MGRLTKIQFTDHGQDFLWWVADETGKVIDCGPFQSWLWCQFTVERLDRLKPGHLVVCSREDHPPSSVNYPVAHVIPLEPIDILVRMDGDGYVTATVRGKRAACTWSDDEAARRLGTKLFDEHLDHIERLPDQPGDRDARIYSRWRIVPKEVLNESA